MTTVKPGDDIQAALDSGGEIKFMPGKYYDAHYTICVPARISGEGAELIGGWPVKWRREGDLLACDVDSAVPIRVLSVGGSLRGRARLPETGYMDHATVFDVPWMSTTGGGWKRKPTYEELTTLTAAGHTLDSLTLDSAEATVVHSWDDSLLTVASVDGDRITFAQPGGHPAGAFGIKKYCLWNLPQGFTREGMFYHDVKAQKLYYKPLPGENETTEAYLPTGETILKTVKPVDGLELEGFTLTVTDTPRISAGFGASQMPGAIEFASEISNSRIHHIKIHSTGGYGIRSLGQFVNNTLDHIEIFDTGAGGFRVGSKNQGLKSVIRDCRVHNVGFYYPSAIGIAATDINILYNEVYHTSYSAINCGGTSILIEGNILHDVMEVLNDGAAIYSFGSKDGIMRRNIAWGINPVNGHSLRMAYYLDEVSSGWTVEDNAAVECAFPNLNHMCGDHVYRHNFFANNHGDLMYSLPRSKNISYIGNVFIASGRVLFRTPSDGIAEFRGNRYHTCDGTISEEQLSSYSGGKYIPMNIDETNKAAENADYTPSDRVFKSGDFFLDLTSSGPRSD